MMYSLNPVNLTETKIKYSTPAKKNASKIKK